jgi:hypothetical protein
MYLNLVWPFQNIPKKVCNVLLLLYSFLQNHIEQRASQSLTLSVYYSFSLSCIQFTTDIYKILFLQKKKIFI